MTDNRQESQSSNSNSRHRKVLVAIAASVAAVGLLFVAGSATAIVCLFRAIAPGEEVSRRAVQPAVPFSFSYEQQEGGGREVWLDMDVAYEHGLGLSGPLAVSINGEEVVEHRLTMVDTFHPPIEGQTGSRRFGWIESSFADRGSVRGMLYLFTILEVAEGSEVTVAGEITASAGTEVENLELVVTL